MPTTKLPLPIVATALLLLLLPAAARAREDSLQVKLGDGQGWHFLGGQWTEDNEGVIRPPDRRNLHSRTFSTVHAFQDLTAEFEFNANYRETGSGSAGLVLRARDANHFYLVYFPWGGQQLRAMHFWAIVAKVDGDGYLRNLAAAWVPGVPSETDRWYRVRVEAQGPQISVWVDDRRALQVRDDTYKTGCVGLAGYGWYSFRNVRLAGARVKPPAWNRAAQIPTHAFTVGFDSEHMPTGCVAPNGDVLLAAGNHLVRSSDKGHTWSQAVPLPEKLGPLTDYGSTLFRTAKGRLLVMVYRTQEQVKRPEPEILLAESADNGLTWSDPAPAQVATNWPAEPASLVPYGPLIEAGDGSLNRFLLGGVEKDGRRYTNVRTWGATHCKAFAIRSTDGGRSWSAPIELDRTKWSGTERGDIPGSLDFTEPTGVAIGNTLTVLIRPIYSQTMWQCWSHDGGASYDAAARTTFPGYAQSMIRTRSGAIVCAHRYPHYSINVSRDDGLNWDEGTVIDYAFWGMGCLVEVEPDVVLCTYMNWDRKQPLLAQLVRVTRERVEPVPHKAPRGQ
ncbi:MAG: exo-alpha-sialidase [Verrucomicrobia bacterium]|nr:exo-alpha-sialidase [Verrucomicrobiota bacterium]